MLRLISPSRRAVIIERETDQRERKNHRLASAECCMAVRTVVHSARCCLPPRDALQPTTPLERDKGRQTRINTKKTKPWKANRLSHAARTGRRCHVHPREYTRKLCADCPACSKGNAQRAWCPHVCLGRARETKRINTRNRRLHIFTCNSRMCPPETGLSRSRAYNIASRLCCGSALCEVVGQEHADTQHSTRHRER